ncbi:hypothetical protein COU36_03045 [Candidatus Micrarchaeota archaeon CG10_big_fil_rev_8_21_14_0_10_59_7]|nr:MAG: hypothetical protein COU36_03045 [Candidatus Micrarchaeota archaeon CG10_big_fil_rev_8_21_14_0_10_59_7]
MARKLAGAKRNWIGRSGWKRLSPEEREGVMEGYRIAVRTFGRRLSETEVEKRARELLGSTLFHYPGFALRPSAAKWIGGQKAVFIPKEAGINGRVMRTGSIRLYQPSAVIAAHEAAHVLLNKGGKPEYQPLATALSELVAYREETWLTPVGSLPSIRPKTTVSREEIKGAREDRDRWAYAVGKGIALKALGVLNELVDAPYEYAYHYVGYLSKGQTNLEARMNVLKEYAKAHPDSPKTRYYALHEIRKAEQIVKAAAVKKRR